MHQALLIFVALPVVYSVSFFGWCFLAEKAPIFSKRNSRSMLSVICGHTTFLLILVILAQMALRFYPSLPTGFTELSIPGKAGVRHSFFELLCIFCILAIGVAEKRWIYVDRGLDESESNGSPS
jgi:hypothetical protein